MSGKAGKICTIAVLAMWIVLQLYTNAVTFFVSFYYTYSDRTWIALGLWILSILVLNVLLYFWGSGKLLCKLKWWWAICCLFSMVMPIIFLLGERLNGAVDGVGILLGAFVMPLFQYGALSWLALGQRISIRIVFCIGCLGGGLLCLVQSAYIAWLRRRAKTRGETADGPVDPGAAAVESGL